MQSVKNHRSAADDKLLQRGYGEKKKKNEAAVQYCIDNNCMGYAALSTGRFDSIKDGRMAYM